MKKKLLVVLGRGGHTEQMIRLVRMLGDRYDYEYVIGKDDALSEKKINHPGKVFRITNPRKMQDRGVIVPFLKMFPHTLDAINILFKSKAKHMVVCGPALSIPIAFLAKIFFRKKLIFIESWSRVKTKSLSGKLVGGLADKIFIQWPQQKTNYPKAIYAGRFG